MNEKKYAAHLAKAIFELDLASWSAQNRTDRSRLENIRLKLSNLFTESGYEFAQSDSARIRKRREQ